MQSAKNVLQQNVAPDNRLWLEVNISIEGEQVGVLGASLLSLVADRQLHDLVAQQVVHVHDLRPPAEGVVNACLDV